MFPLLSVEPKSRVCLIQSLWKLNLSFAMSMEKGLSKLLEGTKGPNCFYTDFQPILIFSPLLVPTLSFQHKYLKFLSLSRACGRLS